MLDGWIQQKVCILVKTYPIPAKKGVEVSCTAAVTADGKWMRLFPIPFRFLESDKRFKKYQWIELRVKRSRDPRPESFTIDKDSIKILEDELPTKDHWRARKEVVLPLAVGSYCEAKAIRDEKGFPTLAIFKPQKIEKLVIEKDSENWSTEQLAILRHPDMFNKGLRTVLERIPFKFSYQFKCAYPTCSGHTFMCSDWEMGQSYRSWRQRYGANGWEGPFRKKYEDEMINRCETYFYIGTIAQHPANWIIVGLFYPPAQPASSSLELFPV